jgi:tripartite-type tricarboxylate transporter receptor subunit TctC
MKFSRWTRIAFSVAAALATTLAHAEWPDKPVRLLVPYAAGSGVDVSVRPLADAMGRALGQPVVVDNRPGGNGVIGTVALATAAPDGYTIAFGNLVTLAINRTYFSKLPYDPEKLTPIGSAIGNAYVLIARKDMPVSDFAQLMALARSQAGKVSYGSPGQGSAGHLAGEMIQQHQGVSMVHVPYRTGALAVGDMVNGQLDTMLDNIAAVLPFIKDGRVKALAVTGAQRSPSLPDVPTLAESGLKDFEVVAWAGLVAPPATPAPVVGKLNAAMRQALKDPAVLRIFESMSVDVLPSSPEEFTSLIRKENPRWAAAVKRAGVRAD